MNSGISTRKEKGCAGNAAERAGLGELFWKHFSKECPEHAADVLQQLASEKDVQI